jgi:tripartite-type tricarboxylate transporter receptor subunit TctC
MKRRDVLAFGLAVLSAPALTPRAGFAQSRYPERPIRLVIPFPPGGVNDAVGRPWANKMTSLLGTVVVENQGGAGGSLGAAAVARAQPDGYTILLGGAASHVINPAAATRPLYDPIKDFEPIAILAATGVGVLVHPSMPVRSFKELIDYAKTNSGKLSYGTAGAGTPPHLSGELFKSLTGATGIVHVPYKGAGPALIDLVSGQIPMALVTMTGQVLELYRSGKVRLLAVTTPARLIAAPEIPTAVESGLPGMVVQSFAGLFAPAGTPKAIIEKIAQATRTAVAEPDFQRMLMASGFEPYLGSTPEKTTQFVRDEIARWTPIIKSIGLSLD